MRALLRPSGTAAFIAALFILAPAPLWYVGAAGWVLELTLLALWPWTRRFVPPKNSNMEKP